jgi:glycosyltransferase involved in cell wall biosynthesis
MTHKNLYILGTRGIPAAHGGFETFAQDLAFHMTKQRWNVTVYCQSDKNQRIMWQDITCHHIKASNTTLGTAWFDLQALLHCLKQESGIMLTLGYNTGFFNFIPKISSKKQIINMDGIEWKRGKWSLPYKLAFYLNYICAGIAGDVLIADNPGIEDLLSRSFNNNKIKMIPYGASAVENADPAFLTPFGLTPQNYAILIARPEPENSILEIVEAWSQKPRDKKLIVLGTYNSDNNYHKRIRNVASNDVVFPGALYNPDIVKALRYYAAFYLHGHTVGGTNPSLVEALSAGNAVIAHDNIFNRWTAGHAALYFKDKKSLSDILNKLTDVDLNTLRQHAVSRHAEAFQLDNILYQYELLCEHVLTS